DHHGTGFHPLLVGGDADDTPADSRKTLRQRFDQRAVAAQSDEFGGGSRGFGRGRLRRHALAIGIEATPGLAPQPPRLDQLLLYQRGRKARVAKEGAEDRTGYGEVDILADQVGELERPHAEAAALAQHRINGGGGGRLLGQQPQTLGVERPGDAVDDEAGGGTRANRGRAPGARQRLDLGERSRVAGHAADDLDQLHQRRGVEEVHADQTLRRAQGGGDGGDGKRGGVPGEQAVGADQGFELGEEA